MGEQRRGPEPAGEAVGEVVPAVAAPSTIAGVEQLRIDDKQSERFQRAAIILPPFSGVIRLDRQRRTISSTTSSNCATPSSAAHASVRITTSGDPGASYGADTPVNSAISPARAFR